MEVESSHPLMEAFQGEELRQEEAEELDELEEDMVSNGVPSFILKSGVA